MSKRIFDIAASSIGLVFFCPLFVVIAVLIRLDSEGAVFFVHERIGRDFKPFGVIKFRTMNTAGKGLSVTASDDPRITRVGAFLRRTKLDELPQVINVLKGEMSLVGPRPEVAEYVDDHIEQFRPVLSVRPGITDPASLAFKNEQELLAGQKDPDRFYREWILPQKLALSTAYVDRHSLWGDVKLIVATFAGITTGSAPMVTQATLGEWSSGNADNSVIGLDISRHHSASANAGADANTN